jgi:Ca-activated chloride channel family protein
MIFLNPDYLLFMLIPTFILFFFIITRKSNIDSVFDQKIIEKLTFDNGSLGRVGRNFMLFAALLLTIIALARPAIEKENIKIKGKKIDMLIAIDISKSMLATDIYPNRLEFAKQKIYDFIESFKEANIGVIAFSSEGFLVSPMTQDSSTLKYLIKNLSLDSLSSSGTDLTIPILKAKSFLKESKQKIVIIFTDGGDNESFEDELKLANEADEHIYIYATATNIGSPITENGVSVKDKDGNIVITKLNQNIKTLALESGGAYIVGGLKDESIKLLVEDIKKKFQMSHTKSREIKEYKELFYYPLGLAVMFMLFAFSSLPRRNTLAISLIVLNISTQNLHAGVFDFNTINRAEDAYKEKRYKEAIKAYRELSLSKKDQKSLYDLANALYKDKRYDQALNAYNKVISKDNNLEYKKLFNSANALFKLKKYEDALKTYENAKKIKTEPDLEHNIEITKKMIQKKKNKKQDKNRKDNRQKPNNKKNQKQQEKKENKKDDKQNSQNESSENQSSKHKKEKQNKKEQKISEKEAKKWQERLEKRKPKTMPMKFKNASVKRKQIEKPW